MSIIFSSRTAIKAQLQFTPLIQNLKLPVNIKNAGDGSGRLFIIEQYGLVRIYKNDSLLSKPFLDIRHLIDTSEYEGIWSIAFPRDYKTNRRFFLYYVDTNGYATLARFRTSNNPDSAIANSGVVLFSLPPTGTDDPHLGEMHFGKDGYLYIAINDGSIYNNNTRYAQDGNLFYGKMLRLNINVVGAPYYKVPPDNPFITDPNIRDEIWATGLRNAWRWSFDKKTGNLWIGEVGNSRWEEIDVRTPKQPFGANFGWPCYEGPSAFLTDSCRRKSFYVSPVYVYGHKRGNSGEVLTGGYVYRGLAYPSLYGWYICIDYTTGTVRMLKPKIGGGGLDSLIQDSLPTGIASFGEGENGELYAAGLWNGTVYHIEASGFEPLAAPQSSQMVLSNNEKTGIYPTAVNNNTIFLQTKENYKLFQLFDMSNHEIVTRKLNGATAKMMLTLPELR
jgi:glucose/arabinose dehydrogenase